jgi:hypothetical protein
MKNKRIKPNMVREILKRLIPAIAIQKLTKNIDLKDVENASKKILSYIPKPLPNKPMSDYTLTDQEKFLQNWNAYLGAIGREKNVIYSPEDTPMTMYGVKPDQVGHIDSKDLTKYLKKDKPAILNVAPDEKTNYSNPELGNSEINDDNVNYHSNDEVKYVGDDVKRSVEGELLNTELNSIEDFEKDHFNKLRKNDTYIPR